MRAWAVLRRRSSLAFLRTGASLWLFTVLLTFHNALADEVHPGVERPEGKKERELKESFLENLRLQEQAVKKRNPQEAFNKELLVEGVRLLNDHQYAEALGNFRKCRELDPGKLPPWFYEIRTLRLLKREEEAKIIAQELLLRHSEVKDLPMFQALFGSKQPQ